MLPNTRRDAILQGSLLFHTGRPCRRGHVADRYTSTGNCVECLRGNQRDQAALLRAARQPVDDGARMFTYRLCPEDHAAALAFCQALDLERGRVPSATQAAALPEPPRSATAEEVEAHRQRMFGHLEGEQPARRHMTEEMRRNLREAGIPLGDE